MIGCLTSSASCGKCRESTTTWNLIVSGHVMQVSEIKRGFSFLFWGLSGDISVSRTERLLKPTSILPILADLSSPLSTFITCNWCSELSISHPLELRRTSKIHLLQSYPTMATNTTAAANENINSNTTVKVSTEILNSLLKSVGRLNSLCTSVEEIQQTVSTLQNDKASLRDEIRVLRGISGVEFIYFPKLPTEIRRMIFACVMEVPQLHIVTEFQQSRSRINTVMRICRESWTWLRMPKSLNFRSAL